MKIEEYIEKSFEEMIKEISKILAIRTVKEKATDFAPYGKGVEQGLISTLKLAQKMGFRTVNLDNYIGYAEYGEGEDYIAILGHLDVVHEGTGWAITNPYEPKILDGNLYARGSLDNKSPIISCLYSLKALIESYPEFNTRVRIIFGCNEESGTDDIEYYLSKEKPPIYAFTPDGRFPVIHAEKGMFTCSVTKKFSYNDFMLRSGEKSNVVPQEALILIDKNYLANDDFKSFEEEQGFGIRTKKLDDTIEITCIGKSAHAASPQKGKNAIVGLMLFIKRFISHPGAQEIADFFLDVIGLDFYGETLGISCQDKESGCLTQNTAILSYDNNELFLKFNIRYPVSFEGESIIKNFKTHIQKNNALFTLITHNRPLYFPKNHPFIQVLHEVYQEITGRQEEPCSIGGGTYAKLMPNTVAFGPNFPELNSKAHQTDEYIPLDTIKTGAIIYAYALKKIGLLIDQ